MSNKRKKQIQRKSFPWPLVVLGGILLIVAAFFFTNQGGDGGGTPSIAVDQQKIDFGYVKLGEYRKFKIKITNNGTGTLRFKETPYIEVLQGCCQPNLTISTMSLKPGSSA